MDLDGAPASEASDDSFVSDDAIYEEEEDFRPAKRGRGHKGSRKAYIQRVSSSPFFILLKLIY